jgi:hypothetical protein
MCTIPINADSHDTLNLSDTILKFHTLYTIIILGYLYVGRSYTHSKHASGDT